MSNIVDCNPFTCPAKEDPVAKEKQARETNLALLRQQLIEERNKYFPQMQFNFESK